MAAPRVMPSYEADALSCLDYPFNTIAHKLIDDYDRKSREGESLAYGQASVSVHRQSGETVIRLVHEDGISEISFVRRGGRFRFVFNGCRGSESRLDGMVWKMIERFNPLLSSTHSQRRQPRLRMVAGATLA